MNTAALETRIGKPWAKPAFIRNPYLRWALYISAAVYLVLAVSSIEVNWLRVYEGLERGWRFIEGFLVPDFTSRWGDIQQGFVESLTMTVTSTVIGVWGRNFACQM